jgi:hypothetical protein
MFLAEELLLLRVILIFVNVNEKLFALMSNQRQIGVRAKSLRALAGDLPSALSCGT